MAQQVRDVMTAEPVTVGPTTPVLEVAKTMAERDIGEVLVGESDRLCGLVTDRDIVVRGIAQGRDPKTTTIDDICSHDLITLTPDDTVDAAFRKMSEHAVRRLPVLDAGHPIGVVSLCDISMFHDSGEALDEISAAPPDS